jgi:Na+/melibiose symporter-like transporter
MSLIQKIQNQPQAVKLRIMWTVSVVVVILLIIVWVISSRFQKNVAKNTTLFQTIGQGIHNIKANYKK